MEKNIAHPEVTPLTPELVKQNYAEKRIKPDASFGNLYSTFKDDMDRADRMKALYEGEKDKDELGAFGEALVFTCIEQGALGSHVTARGTNIYDDYFHGADIIIESTGRQSRDPIVSSIDVTLSQQALGMNARSRFESEGVVNEVGLPKKLERIKRHIEYISSYPREKAVEMSAWLQSGGLSQPRTPTNKKLFDEAEKLMLLKYYKNPTTSEDPNRPHYVLDGPQVVVSVDRSFINKVMNENQREKSMKDINMLIQAEVPYAVALVTQYLDGVAQQLSRSGQAPNLFFDMTRAASRAWELTFATEQYQARLQQAIQYCLKDPELKKQFMYYQQTLHSVFASKYSR